MVGGKSRLPVAAHLHLAVLPLQPVGGQQLFHALEKGVLSRRILVGEIQLQLVGVQLLFELRMVQKALDLAAEQKCAGFRRNIIVQRLDAKMVAGAKQRPAVFVPQGKGEHPPQPGQKLPAPLLVAVQQNLGVATGGKGVSGGDQLLAQRLEVVDLAVEHNGQAVVLVEHRLPAALQVDDGQPPVAQCHRAVDVMALAVRAAVGDAVGHLLQNFLHIGARADKACDSTHTWRSSIPGSVSAGMQCPRYPVRLIWLLYTGNAGLKSARLVKSAFWIVLSGFLTKLHRIFLYSVHKPPAPKN